MACLEFECPDCGRYWSNNGPLRWQHCPFCGLGVRGDWDEERERPEKLDIEPEDEV